MFSSLNDSLTAKESDLPCLTQERDRNVAGAENYLQQNDQTFFVAKWKKVVVKITLNYFPENRVAQNVNRARHVHLFMSFVCVLIMINPMDNTNF